MLSSHRILVIRNDKLGDFMLAWPAFTLLKQQYPDCNITALVPEYTRELAEYCSWIDDVIVDERRQSAVSDISHLAAAIRHGNFEVSISLYSEFRTSLALWLARVPLRIGPATKIAQLFINRRLRQCRSRSEKPEHEYNTDLIRHYIQMNGDEPLPVPLPPFLVFEESVIARIREAYRAEQNIDSSRRLVIIHPGSGGSANNLTIDQYARLVHEIAKYCNVHFIVTAGPGETDIATCLAALLDDTSHSVYLSSRGLVEFSRFIAICDLFISGSTGPLHIAGALNVATAAFYPARRSATSLRWQTLNQFDRRLAFMADNTSDMRTLDMNTCARGIIDLLD
jgi:ADP-heptose:LPS heptosyltransferase